MWKNEGKYLRFGGVDDGAAAAALNERGRQSTQTLDNLRRTQCIFHFFSSFFFFQKLYFYFILHKL